MVWLLIHADHPPNSEHSVDQWEFKIVPLQDAGKNSWESKGHTSGFGTTFSSGSDDPS